jgi:hypothetical protein
MIIVFFDHISGNERQYLLWQVRRHRSVGNDPDLLWLIASSGISVDAFKAVSKEGCREGNGMEALYLRTIFGCSMEN